MFKSKCSCDEYEKLISKRMDSHFDRITKIEKQISHTYYNEYDWSQPPKVTGLVYEIGMLQVENKKLKSDVEKLKGIVAELVDYVYKDNK